MLPYLAVVLFNAGLLFPLAGSWWSSLDNSLYYNGRWEAGKNTGKFVFQTFHFLFAPLDDHKVRLNGHMGFHEILYRQPETAHRRLRELAFDFEVSNYRYLWVELRKEGQRMLGVRLSRLAGYESGFYEYDEAGGVVRFEPLAKPLDPIRTGTPVENARLTYAQGKWTLHINGQPHGQTRDVSWSTGQFGFRGSGATDEVLVSRIRMTYEDPDRPGSTWTEKEDFDRAPLSRTAAGALGLFTAAVLLLRAGRQYILAGYLATDRRSRWHLLDQLALTAALLLVPLLPFLDNTERFGGSLLVAELGSLVLFAVFRKSSPGETRPAYTALTGSVLTVLCVLSSAAFIRHESGLGRQDYKSAAFQVLVHPDAFTVDPAPARQPQPISLTEPFVVEPHRPYFTGPLAFREQQMDLKFSLPANSTLDLVFQQQSFRTSGDPDGEALPLQRRLLRLSTHPHVPTGVATRTGRIPGKFYRIEGRVSAKQANRLTLISEARGLTLALNGKSTTLSEVPPLGFGECGLLAYENPVTISSLVITPAARDQVRQHSQWIRGAGLPLLVLLGLLLLHRPAGKVPVRAVLHAGLCLLVPAGLYLAGCTLIDRDTLSFLSGHRVPLLDLTLAASALNLFYYLLLAGTRMRFAPLYGNLYLVLLIAASGLFTWDHRLPDTHPLKVKMNEEAQAPAGTYRRGKRKAGPWYNDPVRIGANIYIWNQRIEGRPAPGPKQDGVPRIFVMGGSQAWGSGAADSNTTFTRLLGQHLQQQDLPAEVFNAAINGAGIFQINAFFREVIAPSFEPDILVIDFGLNDSAGLMTSGTPEKQLAYLQQLLSYCRERHIEVLVVQEPMCGETPLRPYPRFYEAVQREVESSGYTCLQAIDHFNEAATRHFVWWDVAHLAPFGQQLMADFIAPDLEKLVRKRLASPGPSARAE